jgi:hypothetical protein
MYGENGARMRAELAALLRQHRIQQRLGWPGAPIDASRQSIAERQATGLQIRRYRHTVLGWCTQAVLAAKPLIFSATLPAPANPFRASHLEGTAVAELARSLHHTTGESSAGPASLQSLTTPSDNPVVEHWRHAARAAALAEHDTNGPEGARLTAAQAQALVGDVAAITQALVVLDQRYTHTPGWEKLSQTGRLGWAALASALDVSLGQPDYSVDQTGWRPRVKTLRGPAKPGIIGALQAEHNLLVHMKAFPSATNLRLIVDSQHQLSRQLVPFAARIDEHVAERWSTRATTYALLQLQLRNIAGQVGKGGLAVVDGATALSRLNALPADTIVEPRVLGAFQRLFDPLDRRIADVIEDGVDKRAYLQRVTLPRLVEGTGALVAPVRERFTPIDRTTDRDLIQTVRGRLVAPDGQPAVTPEKSRAELHAALVHRPERSAGGLSL